MENYSKKLEVLRSQMSRINLEIMEKLNRFFEISSEIGRCKDQMGLPHFGPERESEMLKDIMKNNRGPLPQDKIKLIFKEIFKASVEEMSIRKKGRLKVTRLPGGDDVVIEVRGIKIGGKNPVLMAGPCAVESDKQIYETACYLNKLGVKILRGGAFKPRTSPYSFQGLEESALKMLRKAADEFNMAVITEVLDSENLPLVEKYTDILQVGTRNMFNYSLLKAIGKAGKPVMLKRGMMATIDEFILAAEYIFNGGNKQIIMCERGIRTFENQTRNTLDISAIPILKKELSLPVIVDISHSTGRKDIIKPIARAALSAGADGLMFESHYMPSVALSDSSQQLDPEETEELIHFLKANFRIV